jgi:hypothetical protein
MPRRWQEGSFLSRRQNAAGALISAALARLYPLTRTLRLNQETTVKNKIVIYGLAMTLLVNAAPPRVTIAEPDEIKELDRCVQKRFQDPAAISQRRFGMGRMGQRRMSSPQPPPQGRLTASHSSPQTRHRDVRDFKSENPAEQAVIDAFRSKGYEVIVYLAGRKVLEQPPAKTQIRYRYGVQGPALITGKSMPTDPPSTPWLLAESRTALESFEVGDGYTLKRGTWTVAMRPLRVANSGCVSCHTSGAARDKDDSKAKLAIGDPVGVAIYAYRKINGARQTDSPK